MRCGRHSANFPLEDLGREEAVFLAFQNEVRLMLQVLRRKKKTDHKPLAKRSCNFEKPCCSRCEGEHVHPGLRFYLESPRDNSDNAGGGAARMNYILTLVPGLGPDS
jgi:hypothetical protein